MKKIFPDFIKENTNCNQFANNVDAIMIFDFLSQDESIIKMIEACESGKPALYPVAKAIEDFISSKANPTISFDDKFTKQAVGLMVKSILEPFGYIVNGQKILPKVSGATKFTSASCYKFDLNAPISMRVVKKIEAV